MGRIILYKGMTSFFRSLSRIIASLVLLCALLVGILVLTLSSGPISLNFAITYIEKQIQDTDESYDLEVKQAQLIWDKEQQCLVIHASEIQLLDRRETSDMIAIPDLELRYRLPSLIKGKFVPAEVAVVGPRIKLYQTAEGSISFYKDATPSEKSLNFLSYLPKESSGSQFKTIRRLIIKDLIVDIENLVTGEVWQIPEAVAILTRHKSSIDFDLSFDVKGAKANAKINAELIKQAGGIAGMNIDLSAVLNDFQFDDLDKFWHSALAPKPRKWIIENLNGAKVTKADLQMKWRVDFKDKQPRLEVDEIGGEISFKGMDVQYLDTMPKVTQVDGVAKYNKERFSIDVKSGHLKDIKVKNGLIRIDGLDQKDQVISIDLLVEGPLKTGLVLLRNEPLNLDKKLALKVDGVVGLAEAKLHFDFPLETTLTPEQVNVTSDAQLKGVQLTNVLGKTYPVDLKNGDLHLKVDRSQLTVEGKAICKDQPITLRWQQQFEDHPKNWRSRYDIKTLLGEDVLTYLGVQSAIEGPVAVDLSVLEKDKDLFSVEGTVDLTQAGFLLPFMKGLNKPGDPAKLQFAAEIKGTKLQKLNRLILQGHNLQLDARVQIDPRTGECLEFAATNVKLGEGIFSVKMKRDKHRDYFIDVIGSVLDFRSLIQSLNDEGGMSNWNNSIHFSLTADKVIFENDQSMADVQVSGILAKEGLEELYATSELKGYMNDKKGQFTAVLETNGDVKRLHIDSNHAGLVLAMFGITKTAHQGKFYLDALKKGNEPWKGKLTVKDFYVTKAPVITQILSLASPLGIIDAVTGQPITFSKLRTMFKYKDGLITLRYGRAAGKSIGFTFSGFMNSTNKEMDLSGTIMPYNAFNMFLTKIPLVGSLLGGKGGGIIGINYHLKGNQESPSASVNPLSVFTPGILRKIFTAADEDGFVDDEDNDNEEDGEEEPFAQ